MSIELKPCPFCGGTDLHIALGIMDQVYCEKCDAYGPARLSPHSPAGWNTRAAPDESDTAKRWEKAINVASQSIDPLRPPGEPGSYARGNYNGFIDAIRTIRSSYQYLLHKGYPND